MGLNEVDTKNTIRNRDRFSDRGSYFYNETPPHILRRKEIVRLVCKLAKKSLVDLENTPLRLLEVGVGDGLLAGEIKCFLNGLEIKNKYTGVDLDLGIISGLTKDGIIDEAVESKMERLPFPDNYYGMVIVSEVLEHLQTPFLGTKEIYRVMKPGAFFVGSVPNAGQFWDIVRLVGGFAPHQLRRKIFDEAFTHESHFTPRLLKEVLLKSGFTDIELHTNFIRLMPWSDLQISFLNKVLSCAMPSWGDRLIWLCRK